MATKTEKDKENVELKINDYYARDDYEDVCEADDEVQMLLRNAGYLY